MSDIEALARQVLEAHLDLSAVHDRLAGFMHRRHDRAIKVLRMREEAGERDPESKLDRMFEQALIPDPKLAAEMAMNADLVRRLMALTGPGIRVSDLVRLLAVATTLEENDKVRDLVEELVGNTAMVVMQDLRERGELEEHPEYIDGFRVYSDADIAHDKVVAGRALELLRGERPTP